MPEATQQLTTNPTLTVNDYEELLSGLRRKNEQLIRLALATGHPLHELHTEVQREMNGKTACFGHMGNMITILEALRSAQLDYDYIENDEEGNIITQDTNSHREVKS